MVYYCWHDEAWRSEENTDFYVDMTPDAPASLLERKFETEKDFYDALKEDQ